MVSNTVAVFGATGGIGIEIVKAFLRRRKWSVIAVGRNLSPKRFLATVGTDGARIVPVKRLCYRRVPDIGRAPLCDLIDSCGAPRQRPRVYVNATGTCFYAPFISASPQDFNRMITSNLRVSFHLLKHVCSVAHRDPSVPLLYVEIGSQAGANVDHPNFSLYAMVKQGQVGLLRTLASEMEGTRCAFLVLSPGGVNTRLYDRSLGDRLALRRKFEANSNLLPPPRVAEALLEHVGRWLRGEPDASLSSFIHRPI